MNAMRPQTLSTPRALQLWASALLVAFFLPGSAAAQSELRGNVQNPTFSPSDRALVAYSRQVEDTQELYLYDAAEGTVRQITAVEGAEERGGTDGFFEAGPDPSLRRFEGQLAWRPVLDSDGRQWFAFVSSASETGYGLFLSYLTPEGELAAAGLSSVEASKTRRETNCTYIPMWPVSFGERAGLCEGSRGPGELRFR